MGAEDNFLTLEQVEFYEKNGLDTTPEMNCLPLLNFVLRTYQRPNCWFSLGLRGWEGSCSLSLGPAGRPDPIREALRMTRIWNRRSGVEQFAQPSTYF